MARRNTRNAILEAGTKLFIERGYNGCSVQDITEAAGVPKGSFYNHFASKEELGSAFVAAYAEKGARGSPIRPSRPWRG